MKISTVIITRNEQKNIARCIESVQGISDEIVVLDSFSTDKTEEICRNLGAKFYQQEFKGYGEQKRDVVALASYDTILSIDADEALTTELQNEIAALKTRSELGEAYYIKRRNFYCGHRVRFCGWYPDASLRLFDRRTANWCDANVHESVKLQSGVTASTLKNDMLHYTYESYEHHVTKALRYARLSAESRKNKGKKSSRATATLKATFRFLKTYIIRLGFLDGIYGYRISKVSALFAYHKYYWTE